MRKLISYRRYPCPGCGKNMIWREYPHGVLTYQVGSHPRCRKCARKENLAAIKKEHRKAPAKKARVARGDR